MCGMYNSFSASFERKNVRRGDSLRSIPSHYHRWRSHTEAHNTRAFILHESELDESVCVCLFWLSN